MCGKHYMILLRKIFKHLNTWRDIPYFMDEKTHCYKDVGFPKLKFNTIPVKILEGFFHKHGQADSKTLFESSKSQQKIKTTLKKVAGLKCGWINWIGHMKKRNVISYLTPHNKICSKWTTDLSER